MKSQCPTRERDRWRPGRFFEGPVGGRWGRRDAHSGLSIGRKAPGRPTSSTTEKNCSHLRRWWVRIPPTPTPPPSSRIAAPTPRPCRHRAAETTDRTRPSARRSVSTLFPAHGKHYKHKLTRHHVMKLYASLVLSVAVTVAVAHMAHGSPAPGKADAAKIQKNMAKNKGEF